MQTKKPLKNCRLKSFTLFRLKDLTGVSGTGVIAEGVKFHDGQTVVSWFGKFHSIEVHPSIEQVIAIHGHGGNTVVVWDSEETEGEECLA